MLEYRESSERTDARAGRDTIAFPPKMKRAPHLMAGRPCQKTERYMKQSVCDQRLKTYHLILSCRRTSDTWAASADAAADFLH